MRLRSITIVCIFFLHATIATSTHEDTPRSTTSKYATTPSVAAQCTDGNGAFSAQCVAADKNKPFCVNTNCVACLSSCDCAFDQYCSSNSNSFKQCVPFSQAGSSCLPFDLTQLQNPKLPNQLKCASTYLDSRNNTVLDHVGFCLEGVCRMCNPWDTTRQMACIGQVIIPSSLPGTVNISSGGIHGARLCLTPGVFVTPSSSQWTPSQYFGSPVVVWITVIVGIVIVVAISTCGTWYQSMRSPYAQLQ